jgi:fumarate hydratase class I
MPRAPDLFPFAGRRAVPYGGGDGLLLPLSRTLSLLGPDTTKYRLLTKEHVSVAEFAGQPILKVAPEGLTLLASQALRDINFYLRTEHLGAGGARSSTTPEASRQRPLRRARPLLKNAEVAAEGILPFCQDTGTAADHGQEGPAGLDRRRRRRVALAAASTSAYTREQPALLADSRRSTSGREVNTGTNLPAQIDLRATEGRQVRVPLRRQGRRLGQQDVPRSRRPRRVLNPKSLREVPRPRRLPLARHRRLPALPPRLRHRRHQRRGLP